MDCGTKVCGIKNLLFFFLSSVSLFLFLFFFFSVSL